jgi:cytochrome c553
MEKLFLLAALVAIPWTLLAGSDPVAKRRAAAGSSKVERGKYLVTIMGCNDCHTPMKMGPNGPEPDMTRMLSGHPEGMKLPPPPPPSGPWISSFAATFTAFSGPWGVSYAANLTPDQNTGLGIWTEEMFLKALRTGKHMGTSRPIQPPMPWPWAGKATDDDLKAIFAYLKSIPAIVNHVPEYREPAAPAPAKK